MKALGQYRNAEHVRRIGAEIAELKLAETVRLMEVCGGHTAAIYRFALRDLLPPQVQLVSGPGCPVCVTANDFVDRAVALSALPNVTIATFGDLIRVPGSTQSLADARARGADVRVFYSSFDALQLAKALPQRTVIFLAIGFETTACTLAATLAEAVHSNTQNFRMLCALKTMPEALRALFSAPGVHINGLILPGHVTTVTGLAAFDFIAKEYQIPCVVSGFEPSDLMETILMLCRQIKEKNATVENQYSRVVRAEGNVHARDLITQMFEPCDMDWRGFGKIGGSGLSIRKEFAAWDAAGIPVTVEAAKEHPGCRCGEVLRGMIAPGDCGLFKKACTPESPRGACMVSSEGACAAVYHFAEMA